MAAYVLGIDSEPSEWSPEYSDKLSESSERPPECLDMFSKNGECFFSAKCTAVNGGKKSALLFGLAFSIFF